MIAKTKLIESVTRHQSIAGYWFAEDDSIWQLDKNVKVNVGQVRDLLSAESRYGFTSTLAHYASTMSSNHTANMSKELYAMLDTVTSSSIDVTTLINYRATLTRWTEHRLGSVRGFLYKWHDLGYPGISDDVVDQLDLWSLKGNIKGDAVKRDDPTQGPLTDNELLAFNEGAVRAFEKDLISMTDLAMALLTSNTGRRPIQVTHIKIGDLKGNCKNKKAEPMYLISIPKAKQRDGGFRGSFKIFAMTLELWAVLNAQQKQSVKLVESTLGYELQEGDRLMLPLFPDLPAFEGVTSVTQLRQLLETDRLHLKAKTITETLRRVVVLGNIHSERTNKLLDIVARRFRYTVGTRAAREGFGPMIIAELLDHSDIQNVEVYVKNIPEHAEPLDLMQPQLARWAQSFQGVLVDNEQDALRGNDLTSCIRDRGNGIGTCGSYGFCGAGVPVPCYTCMHFQPWLDGPHEIVYAELLATRERIFNITGDETVAAANDRSMLAVLQVIQMCHARREELSRKVGK
jgi:integrase